jgi:hypothetical protein
MYVYGILWGTLTVLQMILTRIVIGQLFFLPHKYIFTFVKDAFDCYQRVEWCLQSLLRTKRLKIQM